MCSSIIDYLYNAWCHRNIHNYPSTSILFNPLSASLKKWSNTIKQFVSNLPMNCLSLFDHYVGLALKGLGMCNYFGNNKHLKVTYLCLVLECI